MTTKYCPGCDQTKSIDQFYGGIGSGVINSTYTSKYCKPCVREMRKQDRLANPGKYLERDRARANTPHRREQLESWQKRNPERAQIVKRNSQRVMRAIRDGLIQRGTICAHCNTTSVRLEAAHKDYRYPLDVTWLCRPCHRRWDAAEPKTLSGDRELPQQLRQRHEPTF